jgi:hypothetical protein
MVVLAITAIIFAVVFGLIRTRSCAIGAAR